MAAGDRTGGQQVAALAGRDRPAFFTHVAGIGMSSTRRLTVGFLACCIAAAAGGQELPRRDAGQDVKSSDVRQRVGLTPGDNLLFNGWGITPAGKHVQISDLPLKMITSPDGKYLASV